jgi:DNA polymerase-3 subunit beta
MKITLDQKAFYERLELVGRVSTKHATLPVLQCVYLEAGSKELVLRATNLEIAIEAKVEATVEEEGVVAVPASTLIQTVGLNTEKEISLRTEDGGLVVEGSGSETLIRSIPHEEFPSIPRLAGASQVIGNSLFSLGIRSSAFAASVSSIKPELGSVYIFQKKEHALTFVATDSFRLMEKTVPQKGVVLESAILLPQKNALEVARVMEVLSSDPACRFNDNQFSLEFTEGVYVTSRLISGSFPDYEQIMPKEFAAKVTLLKEDLARAFKKTAIFLNKFFQIGLYVTKKSLTVSAVGGDVGTTTESLRADTEGDELSLNFNQRYVAEVLPHLADDNIVLQFSGVGRPVIIRGANDVSVRYLVMPMNK